MSHDVFQDENREAFSERSGYQESVICLKKYKENKDDDEEDKALEKFKKILTLKRVYGWKPKEDKDFPYTAYEKHSSSRRLYHDGTPNWLMLKPGYQRIKYPKREKDIDTLTLEKTFRRIQEIVKSITQSKESQRKYFHAVASVISMSSLPAGEKNPRPPKELMSHLTSAKGNSNDLDLD